MDTGEMWRGVQRSEDQKEIDSLKKRIEQLESELIALRGPRCICGVESTPNGWVLIHNPSCMAHSVTLGPNGERTVAR